MRGLGFSARVPLLLHSGRTLLYVEREVSSFVSDGSVEAGVPAIRPWVHYVPVNADLSNLVERARWLLTHPEAAANIAKRGQEHAQRYLTYAAAVEATRIILWKVTSDARHRAIYAS